MSVVDDDLYDVLQIISGPRFMSVWSTDIDTIRYLKSYLIYDCGVLEKNILRIPSYTGIVLDTLQVKENKFKPLVKRILREKWEVLNIDYEIYTFIRGKNG